jgi:glycerophosphoryl diester phosphodiesterase
VALAIGAAAAETASAAPQLVRPDTPWATPAVVAHRGYSKLAPENTLASARLAMTAGAEFVEGDAQPSADGVPFVLHDATLSRTTNGFGFIRSTSSATLDGLDAGSKFGSAYASEPLPRLTALLDTVRAGSSDLVIELKGAHTREQVARVVDEIRAHGMAGRTVIQSFDEPALRDAHELAPEIALALLRNTVDADPVAAVRAVGAVAYLPSWNALKGRREAIAALSAAGIAIVPFTVDDPNEWAAMRDLGIDGIITNDPGGLVAWNAEYRRSHPDPTEAPAPGKDPVPAGDPAAAADPVPSPTSPVPSVPGGVRPAGVPVPASTAPSSAPRRTAPKPPALRARCSVRGSRGARRIRCVVPGWRAGSTVRLTRGGRTYARGTLRRMRVAREIPSGTYRLRRGTRSLPVVVRPR